MSASLIIFETEYISEQINNINKAKSLVEEAESILRKTSQHRNWQCREVTEINNGLNTIFHDVRGIESGITSTGEVLNKALSAFTDLEERAVKNADKLSNDLRNNYGFSASIYGQSENSNLPVTQVPYYEDNTPIHGNANTDSGGENIDNDFASSVVAAIIEAGRVATYVTSNMVGMFLGAVGGMFKGVVSSIGILDTLGGAILGNKINGNAVDVASKQEVTQNLGDGMTQWLALKAGVSAFFGGVDGAFEGGKVFREGMLKFYESFFGKSSNTFLNSDAQGESTALAETIWTNIKNGIADFPIIGGTLADLFGVNV